MDTSKTHLFGYPVLAPYGEARLKACMEKFGAFTILPKGMKLDTRRIRPQIAPEASCLYCASIITGNRCESCGAPRKAEKPKENSGTFPECLHDSGPVREGVGYRRTQIVSYPPKTA